MNPVASCPSPPANPTPGVPEPGSTLLLATRNRHKADEIRAVLGPAYHYLTLADLPGAPDIVEDASTFEGNARKKAEGLAAWLAAQGGFADGRKLWVLADDSGLEVDALGGEPGVQSARYAALDTGQPGNSTDAENNAKLLRRLGEIPLPRRTARFRCVLALTPAVATTGEAMATRVFTGVCEGRILESGRGTGGFGYDPLFQPHGLDQSFAELGEATKNRISHRARALDRLRQSQAG